jgi:excisionase family DNA binding protein
VTQSATTNLFTDEAQRAEARALFQRLEASMASPKDAAAPSGLSQVSPKFARFLSTILEQVASGATFTIGTLPKELTTTVAAEQLGISRMTLMKFIREGELQAYKVGTHTRVRTADVLALRQLRADRQRQALQDLLAAEDEFNIR